MPKLSKQHIRVLQAIAWHQGGHGSDIRYTEGVPRILLSVDLYPDVKAYELDEIILPLQDWGYVTVGEMPDGFIDPLRLGGLPATVAFTCSDGSEARMHCRLAPVAAALQAVLHKHRYQDHVTDPEGPMVVANVEAEGWKGMPPTLWRVDRPMPLYRLTPAAFEQLEAADQEPSAPVWERIDIVTDGRGARVNLDGKFYTVPTPNALNFLKTLQERQGIPISGAKLEAQGIKVTEAMKVLPDELKRYIQTPPCQGGQAGYALQE